MMLWRPTYKLSAAAAAAMAVIADIVLLRFYSADGEA